MGAFLARHGKQLAFIPLLLLIGVLALRLVDTVRGDTEEDATGVDETAQDIGTEAWRDDAASTRPDDATTAPRRARDRDGGAGAGWTTGGSGGSTASGGGGGSIGSGPTLTFTPNYSGSSSSGSSGGSSGSSTGGSAGGGSDNTGSHTGNTGSNSGGGGSDDGGTAGEPSPSPDPTPTPDPTQPSEPKVDPDYNGDGEITLTEANKYCREEKGLGPLRPGWAECLNEHRSV